MSAATTVTDLLDDADVDRIADALRRADELTGAMAAMTEAARDDARRTVAAAVRTVLKVDLGDLLVAGWKRHRELVAAAKATRADRDSTQFVRLAPHTVTAQHDVSTELHCGSVRLTTLTVTATLSVDVDAVNAVVRDGALTEVQCGRCTFTLALTLKGQSLLKRSRDGDALLVVVLPDPVPLLDDEPAPQPQPA